MGDEVQAAEVGAVRVAGGGATARSADGGATARAAESEGGPVRAGDGARARPAEDEHITEELLERLLSSSSPESYLAEEADGLERRGLSQYLMDLLEERGIKRSQAIVSSGLSSTYAYQVFQGKRLPGRDRAIMLAFGMGCGLRETQRLLRLAGRSELWSRTRRDAIIIFCLDRGMTLEQCDAELYRLGEPTLSPEE